MYVNLKVFVVEKSYRHWNKLTTLPICFICDGSELSRRGEKTYSLCRICVLSLMILVGLRSTCKAVRVDCYKSVALLLMFTIRCKLLFLSE